MTNSEQNPFQESTIHEENNINIDNQTSTNDDERLFGMLIYLTSLFTALIAPLIIWLIKRDESSFVDRIGKDYLNFFISYTIWGIVAGVLCLIIIGIILLPILAILVFIFTIIVAVKAYQGETYLPPLSIRFIK